jgi:DNA replication and repair protein RecF
MPPVQLTALSLDSFRVYAQARLEFPAPTTVIVGDNAQGKTSVLEAICALARTKSHRTNRDDEMIRWGADQGIAAGEFERSARGRVSLRMVLTTPEAAQFLGQPAKQLAVNHQAVRGPRDVIGEVAVVVFSPDDLALAKGEPSLRRRFLNVAIGGIQPAHLSDVQQYRRAMRQRGELLAMVSDRQASAEQLGAWDRQLARHGAQVVLARARYVAQLSQVAGRIHQDLTDGAETLGITYKSNVWREGADQAAALEGIFLERLEARRSQDLALRRTMTGPHRDDVALEVGGAELRKFGSQGQQRTAVLAMRLAEAEVARERLGETPLVLLDDCLSELDEGRAGRVLEQAGDDTQLIITTTHLGEALKGRGDAAVYRVEAGEIG